MSSEASTKPLESKEFKVNEYLTLKLEGDMTNIYVNGERFRQCKRLIFNIKTQDISQYDNINSIDEMVEVYGENIEEVRNPQRNNHCNIKARTEYWGHCSNIQAWYENNYDTRLLRSNIAFPLLKKLSEAGDPKAKKAFKDEIAYRITEDKHENVTQYLLNQGYLKYFNKEEISTLLENTDHLNIKSLIKNGYWHLLDFVKKEGLIKELSKQDKNLKKILNPNNTTELNLSYYELKTLPGKIGELTKLNTLELNNNQLKTLPESIGQLKNLQVLDLYHNKLKSLPKSIGELNKLEVLELGHNQLESLPDSIGKLTRLKELRLYYNQLTSLPKNIRELKELIWLFLNHNKLKKVPDSAENLPNCKVC